MKIEQAEVNEENCSTPRGKFVSFLPEFYALADETEDLQLDTMDTCQFIKTQEADNERRLAAGMVWKPKTSFSYDTDGVVVRVSVVDSVSQIFVPTVFIPLVMPI